MDYSKLSDEQLLQAAGMAPAGGLNPMMGNLIRQESGGNPNAVSPKGAAGIAQIMPATARDPGYGVQPLQGWDGVNPATAPIQEQIRFGNDYLNAMQRENGGSPQMAAAAYNAGPGRVAQGGPLPAETVDYVKNVAPQTVTEIIPTSNVSTQIDYSKMSDADLMKAAGIEIPKPKEPTTRDKRIDNTALAIDEYKAGKTGATQAGFRVLGQGLGVINDKIGEQIPQTVKDATSYVFRNAVDANPLARASSMALGQVAPIYDDFAKDNPGRALDLSAAGNLASVASLIVPGPRAVGAVADTAGAIAKPVGKVAMKGVERLATPSRIAPNSEQLAEMGVKAYEKARASGEMFDAGSVTNKFVSAIESAKPRKIAGTVETDLSQALEANLGKYKELANKPLGIDEIDIIDKDLSNLKDQAYNAGKNQLGSELANIQNALRGAVADSPSGQTLAEARDLFRRKYQMEDVERIFRNAEGRPNEAAIIQTGYRNLANQARKKGSGYTKDQIALMDKAAKGGLSIDALKLASSKLIPIAVGASGNGAGAGIAYMGNLAAGAGATALQTAKANRLAKSITKGITVEGEPTRLNKAAAKLTKQDLQKAFEAKKGIKK